MNVILVDDFMYNTLRQHRCYHTLQNIRQEAFSEQKKHKVFRRKNTPSDTLAIVQ